LNVISKTACRNVRGIADETFSMMADTASEKTIFGN
jgi:hypothetical protein